MHIMKTPTPFRILVTTTLMAALALVPWNAWAQQAPAATPTEGAQATMPLVEHLKVEDGLVWVKSGESWRAHDSATLGHAVKALREIYPNATFALDPRVAEVDLSDLIVRANNPMTDLAALRTSSGNRFDVRAEPNDLYALAYNSATDFNPSTKADRKIECFNLSGYLRKEKALDEANTNKTGPGGGGFGGPSHTADAVMRLQEIIQKSIADFDPAMDQPHFQFYSDADMLIVIGPATAIDIASKVIRALPGQQNYTGDGWSGGNYSGPQRTAEQIKAEDAVLRNQLLQGAAPDKSNNANRP